MSIPVEVWRKHKNLNKYLNKRGKLLTWTKIFAPPLGFENQAPYFVGIVEFGKEKMPVQIVDCSDDQIKTGIEVFTVIRRGEKVKADEVIEYSIKVKPL